MMVKNLLAKLRLKDWEIKAIQHCFAQHFNSNDHLWVFGSRTDLKRRGGDIDLYIETHMTAEEATLKRIDFSLAVCDKIGDQKIDIVLHILSNPNKLPIYDVAKKEGTQLV